MNTVNMQCCVCGFIGQGHTCLGIKPRKRLTLSQSIKADMNDLRIENDRSRDGPKKFNDPRG